MRSGQEKIFFKILPCAKKVTFINEFVKFGHFEKDTKFEKIFHLKFDFTQ